MSWRKQTKKKKFEEKEEKVNLWNDYSSSKSDDYNQNMQIHIEKEYLTQKKPAELIIKLINY